MTLCSSFIWYPFLTYATDVATMTSWKSGIIILSSSKILISVLSNKVVFGNANGLPFGLLYKFHSFLFSVHNSRRQHHTPHSHRSHNQQSSAVASMPVASASISSASSFDMPPPPQSPSLKEPLEVGQAAAAAAAGGSAAAAAELAPAALAFKSAGRSLARNIMKRRPRYGRYDVPQIGKFLHDFPLHGKN